MVSQSTLKRVKRFETAMKKLKNISKLTLEEYDKDTDKQDIAERNLQIVIEAIIDIGQKIISSKGFEIPESYKDVITVLEKNNVIPGKHAGSMRDLAGLRNVIVHAYAEIKDEIVYEVLSDDLPTLEKTMEALLKFCKENEIDP